MPTATYCALLKSTGELIYGIGDLDVHDYIDEVYVRFFLFFFVLIHIFGKMGGYI